jgi:excisionase family DNA binding protein
MRLRHAPRHASANGAVRPPRKAVRAVPDAPGRPETALARSFTVAEVAFRLRVGEDKVRAWVRRGELAAVNVAAALCGRPQLRITPEALALFEQQRSAALPPKLPRRRRRAIQVDYYP